MFVLEIRGYMQDADATGELDPIGRISVHEDRDNDGKYEKHSVFVDKLVFPRFVMPFGANAVLTMESNADEVWKFTDTNNDGVADKKELFATGFGRLANVEHQQSGLFWAMDNWLYSTVNAFRARPSLDGGPVRQEPTGGNNAQWGAAMDNYGKVYFQGGASGMPGYFQLPVHYGNFSVPDQFEENLNITWGAPVLIADMQGGLPAVRLPDGSLNRSTAGAGNDVFRGHRLPKDMVGDYFYGETGRAHRPPPAAGEGRRADADAQRVSVVGVHPLDRSAVPPGRHDDRAGRDDVHHRHVSRHHPAGDVVGTRHLPAPEDRAVPARQGHRARPHLAADLRRDGARQDPAADAERDAGAAGRASRAIRTAGGATPRSSCSCSSRTSRWCRRCRSWRRRAARTISSRAFMRCGRWKGSARSTRRSCASR